MERMSLSDADGSQCRILYDERHDWLRVIWSGFVDSEEAMRGAAAYLAQAARFPCTYLLNDNLALRGPWFDSIDWLQHVWLPQAQQLGLRFIAHVVQADSGSDILTLTLPTALHWPLELQLFHDVAAAEDWLRSTQQLDPCV